MVTMLGIAGFVIPHISLAAVNTWQKGASINPRWNTDFSSASFQQSVRNLKATNANYVTLVIPLKQSNIFSADIQAGSDTPTDDALASAIDFIHSLGMAVNLKPHLDSYDGHWRAYINPGDRTTWFNNYGTFLNHYGDIAQAHQVEEITIGTELISMASASVNATNTSNWQVTIAHLRQHFGGLLTYSANWGPAGFVDEKNQIQFWPQLDSIGISAYFNLTNDPNDNVDFLRSAWDGWNTSQIGPLSKRWGKPVLFTEIGYRSVYAAHTQPWNASMGGGVDLTEQANDYEALNSYWNNFNYMIGVQGWNWNSDPNAGSNNTDYTPQHKPAQDVMTKWYSGGGTPAPVPKPSPTPPPSGATSFTITASASPSPAIVGQNTTITTSARDNGSNVSNVIVDIEIYDNGNTKVFQKTIEGQNFTTGQTQNYTASWTPGASEQYKVKTGIFNAGWSSLIFWENDALTFSTSSGGSTTPPPSPSPTAAPSASSMDIWWPTDGTTISGTQPFKAMLTNNPVESYNMFWQVDGGGLNQMANSPTDYPHKESLVDVSGWTWKGAGPYNINFVAKDFSGNLLAQKAVNILVTH